MKIKKRKHPKVLEARQLASREPALWLWSLHLHPTVHGARPSVAGTFPERETGRFLNRPKYPISCSCRKDWMHLKLLTDVQTTVLADFCYLSQIKKVVNWVCLNQILFLLNKSMHCTVSKDTFKLSTIPSSFEKEKTAIVSSTANRIKRWTFSFTTRHF